MNNLLKISIRYLAILIAGAGNLFLFYKTFSSPTLYLSTLFLRLFGEVVLFSDKTFFLFNQTGVYLIDACIAGSAYYLLFILAMSVPDLKPLARMKSLIFCFASLLILNSLRILIMTLIAGTIYFDSLHMVFWYFISIIFVIGIWFLNVKIFNIKSMPIYSDIKLLIKEAKRTKRKR